MYHPDELNNLGPISSVRELSEVITAVVNRILEVATEKTSTGQWYVDYDDVSHIITEQDYLTYFDLIANELMGREEVLDLDTDDHTFDVVCGLAWCKNYELLPDEDFEYGYEELRPAPSMARLAEIGQKAVDHLVLEDTASKFRADDLGITDREVEYTRDHTGVDRKTNVVHQMLPVMSDRLITSETYENLVIAALLYYDGLRHGVQPDPDEPAFRVCMNTYRQIIMPMLPPEVKDRYRSLSASCGELSSELYGAMVSGQPTVVLCRAIDRAPDDPYERHAFAAMLAGYTQSLMREAHVHITYSRGTGVDGQDALLAILPITVTPDLLHAFDKKFTAVHDCALQTWNTHWAAAQYRALLSAVTERLATHNTVSPWTAANPEQCAIFACEALGEYIGKEQYEIDQAKLTHNTEKLQRLSEKLDVTTCAETLDRVSYAGIYDADRDLSRRLRLYATDLTAPGQESFVVPKGQLLLAMREMGYEPGYSAREFMQSYSSEAAREVRSVVKGLPRLSLFQQLRQAEQSKGTKPAAQPEQEKGPDHER